MHALKFVVRFLDHALSETTFLSRNHNRAENDWLEDQRTILCVWEFYVFYVKLTTLDVQIYNLFRNWNKIKMNMFTPTKISYNFFLLAMKWNFTKDPQEEVYLQHWASTNK